MRIFHLHHSAIVTIGCLLVMLSGAQSAIIYTSVNRDTLSLGGTVDLTIGIVTAPGGIVESLHETQTFGELVIKDRATNRIRKSNSDSVVFSFRLTIYDVVSCTIPSLPFLLRNDDSTTDTLKSQPIPLHVNSVIDLKEGDTLRLKDIKPQQRSGRPSLLWIWLAAIALLIAGIIVTLRRFLKKKAQGPASPPPKPPYIEAIEALAALESKKYRQRGLVREFIFELSDILKRYIERRFDARAAEFTTEEMLTWLAATAWEKELKEFCEWFFSTTHPVKFAKMIPEMATADLLFERTSQFIEKTKPGIETTTEERTTLGGAQ